MGEASSRAQNEPVHVHQLLISTHSVSHRVSSVSRRRLWLGYPMRAWPTLYTRSLWDTGIVNRSLVMVHCLSSGARAWHGPDRMGLSSASAPSSGPTGRPWRHCGDAAHRVGVPSLPVAGPIAVRLQVSSDLTQARSSEVHAADELHDLLLGF